MSPKGVSLPRSQRDEAPRSRIDRFCQEFAIASASGLGPQGGKTMCHGLPNCPRYEWYLSLHESKIIRRASSEGNCGLSCRDVIAPIAPAREVPPPSPIVLYRPSLDRVAAQILVFFAKHFASLVKYYHPRREPIWRHAIFFTYLLTRAKYGKEYVGVIYSF